MFSLLFGTVPQTFWVKIMRSYRIWKKLIWLLRFSSVMQVLVLITKDIEMSIIVSKWSRRKWKAGRVAGKSFLPLHMFNLREDPEEGSRFRIPFLSFIYSHIISSLSNCITKTLGSADLSLTIQSAWCVQHSTSWIWKRYQEQCDQDVTPAICLFPDNPASKPSSTGLWWLFHIPFF